MRKRISWLLPLAVVLLVVAACTPAAPAQPPDPKPQEPAAQPQQPVAKEDGEQLWEELAEAARAEGRLVIATHSPELRDLMGQAFAERFGVEVEFIIGRGAENVARVQTERAAGLHTIDVLITGITTLGTVLLPDGYLTPIKPLVVHPEALDSSAWHRGEVPYADPEGQYILAPAWVVSNLIVYNADFVDGAELQTSDDLIDPKFRGMMSTDDPSAPGSGLQTALTFLHLGGEDFVRQLYVDQEPIFTDDRRQLYDWLARGTPPITLSVVEEQVIQLLDQGFDVRTFWPSDLQPTAGVGGGHIVALDQGPHPNATKLFLNWVLTAEGQEVYAGPLARTSMRSDVGAPEGIPDFLIPEPGVDYFSTDSWEFRIEGYEERQALIREIVGRR